MDDIDREAELTVTFSPALFLQRRGWIFEIMRREHVTQVLDVGCGEGEIVACLCNAAPWLPLHSKRPPACPPHHAGSRRELDVASLREEDDINVNHDFLHVSTLHALDVSYNDLQQVISHAEPPSPPDDAQLWPAPMRWEPLDVKVWHGSMQVFNPEFVGVECIVSTEVIEHLPEDILPAFAPILLGMYHPRLLLITTPSYTFNSRFTAPDAPLGTRKGIPDPTGRTDRIFRHWDHKFEWTVEEFRTWCEAEAEEWEYDVEVAGVGMPMEKDPFGRDEQLGKATQVAVFTRKEGSAMQVTRERRCAELGLTKIHTSSTQPHQLLGHYHHEANAPAGNAGSLEEIGQLVLQKMEKYKLPEMALTEMWSERDVSVMCEGWLQRLMAAVKATNTLTLHKPERKGLSDWLIVWKGFVPPAMEDKHMATQMYTESAAPIVWADTEGWGENDDLNGTGWGPWGTSWITPEDATWNVETGPEAIKNVA